MLLLCDLWSSVLFLIVSRAVAAPTQPPTALVLWHGLGDTHSSPGMLEFASLVQDIYPGIFIHSIYVDEDSEKDRQAGFYGKVNNQLELVAQQIREIPELKDGFDAIGFSQGGQFLRAYVERYNFPPVHNLITFGSQHMGISDIPGCRFWDVLCQVARRAAKGAVYSEWAQENLIQAQYYRDPANLETYLSVNHFLADINNEIAERRNASYARMLSSLNRFVLVIFTEDKTVIPKESAWFGSEEVDSANAQRVLSIEPVSARSITPMRLQPLYLEDWIGLRALDERGGVIFESCVGEHMQITTCWERLVRQYVG